MKKIILILCLFSFQALASVPTHLPVGCEKAFFHKCEGWEFVYPPTPDKNGKGDPRGEHRVFIPNNDRYEAQDLADAWASKNLYNGKKP